MEKSKSLHTAGKKVKYASTWENSLAVSRVKQRTTIWPSDLIPMYIFKRYEYICPHKTLYAYVHSGIIHNNQKVETI